MRVGGAPEAAAKGDGDKLHLIHKVMGEGGGCGRACDHGMNKMAPFLWCCHSSEVPGWEYSSLWALKAHSL